MNDCYRRLSCNSSSRLVFVGIAALFDFIHCVAASGARRRNRHGAGAIAGALAAAIVIGLITAASMDWWNNALLQAPPYPRLTVVGPSVTPLGGMPRSCAAHRAGNWSKSPTALAASDELLNDCRLTGTVRDRHCR